MGGHLPYFTCTPQLEELLALIKLSEFILPVPIIFIASNKVSCDSSMQASRVYVK